MPSLTSATSFEDSPWDWFDSISMGIMLKQRCEHRRFWRSLTIEFVFDLYIYMLDVKLTWQKQKLGQGGQGKPNCPPQLTFN